MATTTQRLDSWIHHADLHGEAPPTGPRDGCGCHIPLIWDGKRGVWRHLDDGSHCTKTLEDPS